MTEAPDISIVLPAYKAVDHIRRVVPEMMDSVSALGLSLEVVLVVNGPDDGTDAAAAALRAKDPRVQVLRADQPGWGRAVGMGLRAATGNLLTYTNLARTPPEVLHTAVALAVAAPGSVVKANRRVRDSFIRRAGSVLYNLECRLLFELSVFDVNGTPKVFPAEYTALRELRRVDDMIDAEFVATCNALDYQMVEFAVGPLPRHSGTSTTNYTSAWNMYTQAFVLRWDLQRRLPSFIQEHPQDR